MKKPNLVEEIDAILPQTQCEECGYRGCMPYAKALVNDNEAIDLCIPGGTETLVAIGSLLEKDAKPFLNEMAAKTRAPSLAVINEDECIGCTKCIQVCPVDAIIGSNKKMHAILDIECTGCELCIEPCPVDCIEMKPIDKPLFDKDKARSRFNARNARLEEAKSKKKSAYQTNKGQDEKAAAMDKKNYILEALARIQNKSS